MKISRDIFHRVFQRSFHKVIQNQIQKIVFQGNIKKFIVHVYFRHRKEYILKRMFNLKLQSLSLQRNSFIFDSFSLINSFKFVSHSIM